MKEILLTLLAIVCGVICILTSGIVICMNVPSITQNLSRATATVETAKFQRDQLVQMADDTRAFVASEISKNDLYSTVEKLNVDASTIYSNIKDMDFAAVSDEYSLDKNCMNHLEDVRSLFANIKIAFGICSFGAITALLLLLALCGRGSMGRAMIFISLTILIGLAVLAVWAIIDFNALFNWVHSLFFKSDSWYFSQTSLLISMYPSSFWAGMAGICLICAFVESIILLIIGKIVK